MPFVHVIIAGRSIKPQARQRLQQETTTLMHTIMRKRREVTAVLVEEVDLAGWTVGGEPLEVAAYVEANVTLGTNTAEEKERFIQAMDALLKESLGEMPPATYVIVREVEADAWGFDGVTQEYRRSKAMVA
ncbi:4-oxalocrotonate tautomerase [Neorhizobium sp. 2083]|uniref:tautomerase family protein n=1 Tax=Neorhizobium sp. 2083 TaxID=2817762 RepID=UPI00286003DA|nr:tautomerase family protein [Neorhizobium sp. 2083]MDR6815300.1 4-oxalocrotonate tautomerase [Neorhizobium sp. 2083]